jgi:hypothetical protein
MASPGMMSSTVTTSPSPAWSYDSASQVPGAAVPASSGTEDRKRKRKESNRLSAQRCRARKQRQLDDLTEQVAALRARNGVMAAAAHDSLRRCVAVQAENELLRARFLELGGRLQFLLELIQYMDGAAAPFYDPSSSASKMLHQPPLLETTTMYNYCYLPLHRSRLSLC